MANFALSIQRAIQPDIAGPSQAEESPTLQTVVGKINNEGTEMEKENNVEDASMVNIEDGDDKKKEQRISYCQ